MNNLLKGHTLVPTTDSGPHAEPAPTTGTLSRRFMAAGLAGSVAALLGARAASASSSTTTEPSDESTTTSSAAPTTSTTSTTAPPRRPSEADAELLSFILTAEMAAQELYAGTVAAGSLDEQGVELFGVIAEHHRAYANNITAKLAKQAVVVSNETLVSELSEGFNGADAAETARALELDLIATHLDALTRLDGTDAAALLAAIVVVEGQHVAALAKYAGLDEDADYGAFVNEDGDPITPDDYPATA